jgi:hypothetical protein
MSDILEIDEDSNLVRHARAELARTGNDEEFNDCIIKAVAAFAKYGHSGGSASVGINILYDLLQFKPLTPLTNDPKEWNNVGTGVWQSSRNPEAFSEDGGRTYYLLSERDNPDIPNKLHTSERKV